MEETEARLWCPAKLMRDEEGGVSGALFPFIGGVGGPSKGRQTGNSLRLCCAVFWSPQAKRNQLKQQIKVIFKAVCVIL